MNKAHTWPDHVYDPTYNLNADYTGAFLCHLTGYLQPMREFYPFSYKYCQFCGAKLETGDEP